ncbi:hypothetical protein ILUMI_18417, partial [Ignelater luminosus]
MPTFNQNILNSFVEVFAEQSTILVDQLKQVAGKGEFDIYDYVSKCTLDIFCETAMGVKTNAQTTDCDYMKWVSRILERGVNMVWVYVDPKHFLFNWIPTVKNIFALIDKMQDFTAA